MHRFRITVESLSGQSAGEQMQFEADNHDDIIAIARRMHQRLDLDDDSIQAFTIGLKLFSEVVLKNRTRMPYSQIRPAIADFMKTLKSTVREDGDQPPTAGDPA